MLKRIKFEIDLYQNYRSDTKLSHFQKLNSNIMFLEHKKYKDIYFLLIDDMDQLYKICIHLSDIKYPFHPPFITIKHKPYQDLFYTIHKFLKLKDTYLFPKKSISSTHEVCFCCQSIISSHNWQPCHMMSHILEEIYNSISNIVKIKQCILLKYIMLKHIGFIMPFVYDFIL